MTTETPRVAAITGAAQGIGRRTAEVLAAEGFARAVQARYGRIDVLANNAGISCIGPAEETPALRLGARGR